MAQTTKQWRSNLLRQRKPLPKPEKQKKSARGQAYLFGDEVKPACDLTRAERLRQRREMLAEQQAREQLAEDQQDQGQIDVSS